VLRLSHLQSSISQPSRSVIPLRSVGKKSSVNQVRGKCLFQFSLAICIFARRYRKGWLLCARARAYATGTGHKGTHGQDRSGAAERRQQEAPEEAEAWVHTAWCCCISQAAGREFLEGEKSFEGQKSRAHCVQSLLTAVFSLGKRLSQHASPCLKRLTVGLVKLIINRF